MAYRLIEDLGTDIMLAPGGAVQGHPMGAKAGVKAMLDAVQAKMGRQDAGRGDGNKRRAAGGQPDLGKTGGNSMIDIHTHLWPAQFSPAYMQAYWKQKKTMDRNMP